jgi:hypothetical protein
MARSYSIASITQSGGVGTPGRVRLAVAAGNVVSSFQGKFYRDSGGATLPGYTVSPAATYSLIQATTFTIAGNSSYNGTYTVYSPVSAGDTNPPSLFTGTQTEILVNENIGAPATAGDATNTGTVSNISTYLLKITGEADLVVPPTVIFSNRPMDIVGRNGTPWGESFAQNFLELAQNSAGASAPSNPFLGQTWYDIANNEFKLNGNAGWVVMASGAAGANTTYRSSVLSGTTWTVNHNLGLTAPYIALVQVFIDIGGGVYKMILPSDITFVSSNQITITFTASESGIVLIRA